MADGPRRRADEEVSLIKVQENTAKMIVVLLRYLMSTGAPANAIRQSVLLETRRGGNRWDESIHNFAGSTGVWEFNTILEELMGGIFAPNEGQNGNLIEQMSRILQDSLGRNKLTGEAFNHLRRILLLPDEVAATSHLQTGFSCAQCGKALPTNRGIVVCLNEQVFYCTTCAPPYMVLCSTPGCSNTVAHEMIEKKLCHEHNRSEAPANDGVAIPTPSEWFNDGGDLPAAGRPIDTRRLSTLDALRASMAEGGTTIGQMGARPRPGRNVR
jgi:hypothetical protein